MILLCARSFWSSGELCKVHYKQLRSLDTCQVHWKHSKSAWDWGSTPSTQGVPGTSRHCLGHRNDSKMWTRGLCAPSSSSLHKTTPGLRKEGSFTKKTVFEPSLGLLDHSAGATWVRSIVSPGQRAVHGKEWKQERAQHVYKLWAVQYKVLGSRWVGMGLGSWVGPAIINKGLICYTNELKFYFLGEKSTKAFYRIWKRPAWCQKTQGKKWRGWRWRSKSRRSWAAGQGAARGARKNEMGGRTKGRDKAQWS